MLLMNPSTKTNVLNFLEGKDYIFAGKLSREIHKLVKVEGTVPLVVMYKKVSIPFEEREGIKKAIELVPKILEEIKSREPIKQRNLL